MSADDTLLLVGWLVLGFLGGWWVPEFASRGDRGALVLALSALIAGFVCGLRFLS